MRLDLRIAGFRLGISLGPDTDDGPDDDDVGDPGPGASVALEHQGEFGFTRWQFSESPDEWRRR